MVPYILVGMFAAFETEKLRRAILSGAERLSAVNVAIRVEVRILAKASHSSYCFLQLMEITEYATSSFVVMPAFIGTTPSLAGAN